MHLAVPLGTLVRVWTYRLTTRRAVPLHANAFLGKESKKNKGKGKGKSGTSLKGKSKSKRKGKSQQGGKSASKGIGSGHGVRKNGKNK